MVARKSGINNKIEGKFRSKAIPEDKKRQVKELTDKIKKSKTMLIASTKGLPSRQFQDIRKKLRGSADIKVYGKSIFGRATDILEKADLLKAKEYYTEGTALLFSSLNPFELSGILSENKTPAKARIGQAVDKDVIVEPGPTELVPGPIISELSGLGIKFAIEDGKITIKEPRIIIKAGGIVDEKAASIMSKLDIKPVEIGFEPIAAYDSEENRLYVGIKIDKKKTLEDFKDKHSRALAFAVKIAYPSIETIKFLLAKAASHEKALSAKAATPETTLQNNQNKNSEEVK